MLDEPTTGLDPVNVQIVEDLLHERRRNGRTTILSTHHMNQVESLCDRVALINQGQLMVYGGVDEVRRRYSLPEVRVHARGPIPAVAAVAESPTRASGHLPAAALATARPRTKCWRRSSARARVSSGSSRCSPRWKTSSFASCGRDGHERLAEDQDRRDLRVPLDGEAAGLPDCHLRHAVVHGGLRRRASRSRRTSPRRAAGRPAVYGVVDQAGVLRLVGDLAGGDGSRVPEDDAPRARSGRPGGGARSGRHVARTSCSGRWRPKRRHAARSPRGS